MAPGSSSKSSGGAKKTSKKSLPAAPLGGVAGGAKSSGSGSSSSTSTKKVTKDALFEKNARSFRIGGAIQPRRDLSRFVRWPRYIRLQRQRKILLQRLKVPPSINQFNYAIDKNQTSQLLRLLNKYKPETAQEKKQRLQSEASQQAGGAAPTGKKPMMIKFGLNHVTDLVEIRKAKLVIIAHDVDPVELVCWLPALCRKKDIPYCIVKSKARLGKLVHQKNTCVLALDNVKKEDQNELELLCKNFRAQYNDNVEVRRRWGGGIMGIKSQHVVMKREKAIAMEQAKKLGLAH